MKIILNATEIARIVVDRLLSDGRIKHSIEPVDVTWSITGDNSPQASMTIEQEVYNNE